MALHCSAFHLKDENYRSLFQWGPSWIHWSICWGRHFVTTDLYSFPLSTMQIRFTASLTRTWRKQSPLTQLSNSFSISVTLPLATPENAALTLCLANARCDVERLALIRDTLNNWTGVGWRLTCCACRWQCMLTRMCKNRDHVFENKMLLFLGVTNALCCQ